MNEGEKKLWMKRLEKEVGATAICIYTQDQHLPIHQIIYAALNVLFCRFNEISTNENSKWGSGNVN